MTAFRTAPAARPTAFAAALAVTIAMLGSVNALSTQEYRAALTAQATTAAHVALAAPAAARQA